MKRIAFLLPLFIFPTLQESTCGTPSEICDDLDNDGDGIIDEDMDLDVDGYSSCATAPQPGDCNDSDPQYYPTAPESLTDHLDYNCDGAVSFLLEPMAGVNALKVESPTFGHMAFTIPPGAVAVPRRSRSP